MKKKVFLSFITAVALLVSMMSLPAFADNMVTFSIQGKIVLPGSDVAPDDGLFVTIECISDIGTADTADDLHTVTAVVLMEGSREGQFTINVPYTASAEKNPKFEISYKITAPSPYRYWERGYFALGGIQYFKEGQMKFPEGNVSNLIITPIRAAEISGTVGLPSYDKNQSVVEVDITAKTTGTLNTDSDDYEAKARVSIDQSEAKYMLRVPATVAAAGYTVKYETTSSDYEEQGWYSDTGTVETSDKATKVDVSNGNSKNISLQLIEIDTNPENPPACRFDINGDGKVDVKDHIMLARSMGSVKKFVEAFDLNEDGIIDVKDLKLLKNEMRMVMKFRISHRHKFY